jgi:hypothetical protein
VNIVCFRFGKVGSADSDYHERCTLRDCLVDCGSAPFSNEYVGLEAGGGIGTFVEGMLILNCKYGASYQDSGQVIPTRDLIMRDNYAYNVLRGIDLLLPTSTPPSIQRLDLQNNVIDLSDTAASGVDPLGVKLDVGGGSQNVFVAVLLRDNVIRPKENKTGPLGTYGLWFTRCATAIAESNVITIATPDNTVRHKTTGTLQVMDNQTSAGALRQGYNDDTKTHDTDLIAEAQNALLGF